MGTICSYTIECFSVGLLETNCYLFWDRNSHDAVIIDPGAEDKRILHTIQKEQLKLLAIVNTHGHGDHIGANRLIKTYTNAPILIHRADRPMLTNPVLNLSQRFGFGITSPDADQELTCNERLVVGNYELTIFETPGHSPGSICLFVKKESVIFTGDTLFYHSIGRTDIPGGDFQQIMNSIQTQLMTLSDKTVVFPGHGPKTTIGCERKQNPFLVD